MNLGTVYLSATELGLVKWDGFRKPPYSPQDYIDAYNNGQRMTAAFNQANANGASKVVLERGKYPFCYVNSESSVASLTPNNVIENTTDFEIDGNGSVIFAIFDSVNRSPYHTGKAATAQAPHQLSGCLFWLQHNTSLHFHGFNLRGDQYMRSWVTNEKDNEQTYGIILSMNNYDTKIDVVGHGFRGDAISSKISNKRFFNLTGGYQNGDWLKGGVDVTTGSEIVEAGSYRTPRINLQEQVIFRNAVQLITFGGQGHVSFRDDRMQAFFYDKQGVFISSEYSWSFEPIYLPENCGYIQLVAYGDERTDDLVGYGTYLYLATGCSNICEVRGEYFANHRGAISNLCDNTLVDADIHDVGTTKYGFPTYWSTTRYGVNFEDNIVGKLTVKGSIRNCGSAVMSNSRTLVVDQCDIRNVLYAAIFTAATKNTIVTNSSINNAKILLDINNVKAISKRVVIFDNNIVEDCSLYGDYTIVDKLVLNIKNNIFTKCNVSLRGDGKNLIFTDNLLLSPKTAGGTTNNLIAGALKVNGNVIRMTAESAIKDNDRTAISSKYAYRNTSIFERIESVFITDAPRSGHITYLKGLDIESYSSRNMIQILSRSASATGEVFKVIVDDCNFRNGNILLGNYSNIDLCDSITTIQNSTFSQSENTLTHFIDLAIRGSLGVGSHQIHFKNCTFNLTDITKHIMQIPFGSSGNIDIVFSDCTFSADTPKTERLKIFKGKPVMTNITARALDCRFINVSP